MTEYRFRLIVRNATSKSAAVTNQELLDVTDALGDAGCDDATVSVHADGFELDFERESSSLQDAIASAVGDVERAGFDVVSIQMDRESVIPLGS